MTRVRFLSAMTSTTSASAASSGKSKSHQGFKERNAKKRAKKKEEENRIEFVSSEDAEIMKRKKMIEDAALENLNDSDDSDTSSIGDSDDGDISEEDLDDDEDADDNSGSFQARKFSPGSFKTMNFMPSLMKAIVRKGFRQPTPIQRKCIGPLLEDRDVVGMARTGSGKTAAFVLPMVQKLKAHSVKVGARGLVLAPTRELALQTFLFIKAMTKFTDLRSIVLMGGDSFDEQFTSLASNPDIIVASPGRLLHLCIEAKYSLSTVEYVVFDEADRLFEMGFAEQLHELLALMPSTRQTALFSATLPRSLVDFAAAGLSNPLLIRLDADTKLSEDLRNVFLAVQTESKDSMLLYLLKNVVNTTEQLTIVFAATKHHVEYLQELLKSYGFKVGYIYGSLDQEAREQAIINFRNGVWSILIVTDVAARGIDIPLLDNVINYDFPCKPKLFVHRVGRAARAGRSGVAYSLVAPDELPYLIDLQLFLGQKLLLASSTSSISESSSLLGTPMQEWMDEEEEMIRQKIATVPFLEDLKRVTKNAYKLYYKTRSPASPESHASSKVFLQKMSVTACLHPVFKDLISSAARAQVDMVSAIRGYKPKQAHLALEMPTTFVPMKIRGKRIVPSDEVSTEKGGYKDDEFYLPYTKASNFSAAEDRGYSVKDASFVTQASQAVFDLGFTEDLRKNKKPHNAKNMDRQKLNTLSNQKRIKTDHGTSVPATFKTDIYQKWQKKTRMALPQSGDLELGSDKVASLAPKKRWVTRKKKPTTGGGKK
jgi:ATP-dependent RNA helicase DDX54/DBP10